MKSFKKLFENYGFKVEEFGDNSFIATNGKITVPYTEKNPNYLPEICCVSFVASMEEVAEYFKEDINVIGYAAYNAAWHNRMPFKQEGGLYNHDHSLGEVETWLKRITKKNGQA